jgi:Flp pilus assembly protein TadG
MNKQAATDSQSQPAAGGRPGHVPSGRWWPGSIVRLRRPGQALVEFALVTTILAMMAVGVADFARVFYFDVAAEGAALEGARAAAAGAPDDDSTAVNGRVVSGVNTIVRNSAGPALGPSLTVSISPPQSVRGSTSGVGQCTPSTCIWARVSVSYQFTTFTPLGQYLFGSSNTLVRSVSQRMRTPCVLADGATAC